MRCAWTIQGALRRLGGETLRFQADEKEGWNTPSLRRESAESLADRPSSSAAALERKKRRRSFRWHPLSWSLPVETAAARSLLWGSLFLSLDSACRTALLTQVTAQSSPGRLRYTSWQGTWFGQAVKREGSFPTPGIREARALEERLRVRETIDGVCLIPVVGRSMERQDGE